MNQNCVTALPISLLRLFQKHNLVHCSAVIWVCLNMVISGSAKPKLVALEQLSTNQWAMSRFTLESTKRQKKHCCYLFWRGILFQLWNKGEGMRGRTGNRHYLYYYRKWFNCCCSRYVTGEFLMRPHPSFFICSLQPKYPALQRCKLQLCPF